MKILDTPKSRLFHAVKGAVEDGKDVKLVIDGIAHTVRLHEYSTDLSSVYLGRISPSGFHDQSSQ